MKRSDCVTRLVVAGMCALALGACTPPISRDGDNSVHSAPDAAADPADPSVSVTPDPEPPLGSATHP